VGVAVAVSVIVGVYVGGAFVNVGVSLAGRNGVRVGLTRGGSAISVVLIPGAQPAKTNPIKNTLTSRRLIFIESARLQLHLPDRF
jgi:hypothetical protein